MKINNMKYGLGYDWDSVMPGVAAVLVTLKLDGVSEVAQTYLEGYVLAKWEVRLGSGLGLGGTGLFQECGPRTCVHQLVTHRG
jgi:hypothetical protein